MLGYADYYDYKVSAAEGFGKAKLFEILDGLEHRTRDQVPHLYVCASLMSMYLSLWLVLAYVYLCMYVFMCTLFLQECVISCVRTVISVMTLVTPVV
jgi:hypothetical protein